MRTPSPWTSEPAPLNCSKRLDGSIFACCGLTIAIAFAWFLGFGATIAEPALNALGSTAEELTNGVFKQSPLIYAVSTAVAFGIAIGLCKLISDISEFVCEQAGIERSGGRNRSSEAGSLPHALFLAWTLRLMFAGCFQPPFQ